MPFRIYSKIKGMEVYILHTEVGMKQNEFTGFHGSKTVWYCNCEFVVVYKSGLKLKTTISIPNEIEVKEKSLIKYIKTLLK